MNLLVHRCQSFKMPSNPKALQPSKKSLFCSAPKGTMSVFLCRGSEPPSSQILCLTPVPTGHFLYAVFQWTSVCGLAPVWSIPLYQWTSRWWTLTWWNLKVHVHLSNKLGWTDYANTFHRKGKSCSPNTHPNVSAVVLVKDNLTLSERHMAGFRS